MLNEEVGCKMLYLKGLGGDRVDEDLKGLECGDAECGIVDFLKCGCIAKLHLFRFLRGFVSKLQRLLHNGCSSAYCPVSYLFAFSFRSIKANISLIQNRYYLSTLLPPHRSSNHHSIFPKPLPSKALLATSQIVFASAPGALSIGQCPVSNLTTSALILFANAL